MNLVTSQLLSEALSLNRGRQLMSLLVDIPFIYLILSKLSSVFCVAILLRGSFNRFPNFFLYWHLKLSYICIFRVCRNYDYSSNCFTTRRSSPHGLVTNALHCDIVFQSSNSLCCYVYFRTNTPGKGINLQIPQLWIKYNPYFPSSRMALELNDPWRLICH